MRTGVSSLFTSLPNFTTRRGLAARYVLLLLGFVWAGGLGDPSTGWCNESNAGQFPRVFQEGETKHGFSQFDSIPEIPEDTQRDPDYINPTIPVPWDTNQPPQGLFYRLKFAKGFEEEQGMQRGKHVVVPVEATNTFSPQTPSVFLVFTVYQHFSAYEVFGRLYPERVAGRDPAALMDEDAMHLATEDESGYLQFVRPAGGWPAGDYRVEVFVGFQASQFTLMGTVRFSVASDETSGDRNNMDHQQER